MKFNIKDYPGKYVMHCSTEDEANEFLKYLNSAGYRWCDGVKYTPEHNQFSSYFENTAYEFNNGMFAYVDWFATHNYTVLEFTDFEWDGFPNWEEPSEEELLKFIGGDYG